MGLNPICWGVRHTSPPPPPQSVEVMEHVLSTPEFEALEKEAEAREQALQRGVPSKSSKIGLEVGLDPHPRSGFQNETSPKP